LAAVFLEDIMKGFLFKNIKDEKEGLYSKILCKNLSTTRIEQIK
jgi:hypothetical protein